ncbi:GNAT family N-acetyltransferase [Anaeromicropila herbilytica]|uniref:GNAT family N-acetyltransferase n=1 Tax=Anaeromicropila herbilytica TaxID=2785025 RepID=A0A7R7ICW5_9FIRM|nr:GNAT family N-acetyltransferase [Anaeromicropila herbilytica]BCN30952.1 GNAT family N-acetyltransferase [Anaeromicropila herbilytica]
MDKLEIQNGDADTAISIMKEVATWGREKGLRVWLDDWLTKEELLTNEVKEENFYVGNINGENACSFILQWSDSEWWPNAKGYEAAYLHKFCVRRKFAHQGMTRQVIDCIKKICRTKGVKYIRLDTGNNEEVVKQIYLRAGFKIVKVIDESEMALYEMEINII